MKDDWPLITLAVLFVIGVIAKIIGFMAQHWPWFAAAGLLMLAAAIAIFRWHRARTARKHAEWLEHNACLEAADCMNGNEFEELIAQLLRRDGYRNVIVQGGCGDRGIDITADTPDLSDTVAIQCKRYTRKIGSRFVREFIGALHNHARWYGILVTTAEFTGPAIDASQGSTISLIDRADLGEWMRGRPLTLH